MIRVRTCDIPLWLYELVEVRLDEAEPLLDAAFDVSATLAHITEDLLATHVSQELPTKAGG